jgi:heptosyltransferase-2
MYKSNQSEDYKKILIINLGGIGDVLLSTPALRALKSHFPHSYVALMVVPRVAEVINDLPYIDEVFIFYKYAKNLFKNFYTLFSLRRKHFDLAINMRSLVSDKSAEKIKFLLNIMKPGLKVGRNTEERGYFFDIKIPEPDIGTRFEMEYDIDTLKALGVEIKDKSIDFVINNRSNEKIIRLLREKGVDEKDVLICIHPGGKLSHRWPVENFVHVISEIKKKISCRFLVSGDKDETALGKQIVNMMNNKVIDFTGLLSVRELGALIKRCNLFISNDTGPMHIAAILKTPLIAIFGSGYIERYNPAHISETATVLYKKVDCAPCNEETCESIECLKAISPEEVIKAALYILKQNY